MKETKICWANSTWNPMVGCSHDVRRMRQLLRRGHHATVPLGQRVRARVQAGQALVASTGASSHRRYFVNSMSDVHHEAFSTEQIDSVYDVCLDVDRHDYLVLTKRPQRMRRYMTEPDRLSRSIVGWRRCPTTCGWASID